MRRFDGDVRDAIGHGVSSNEADNGAPRFITGRMAIIQWDIKKHDTDCVF